jgi:osmotically-inducible protein OsmY
MLKMKTLANWPAFLMAAFIGILAGCSQTAKQPGVSANIRAALDRAGYKKVSVNQDNDKGVVTLGGHVQAYGDKTQAEALARSLAAGEVIADQIEVLPLGAEGDTRTIDSDLDRGIEQNLDAALIQNKLHDDVKYKVRSRVVKLTGEVASQARRRDAAKIAASVPNVRQVVNGIRIKRQKASSSE